MEKETKYLLYLLFGYIIALFFIVTMISHGTKPEYEYSWFQTKFFTISIFSVMFLNLLTIMIHDIIIFKSKKWIRIGFLWILSMIIFIFAILSFHPKIFGVRNIDTFKDSLEMSSFITIFQVILFSFLMVSTTGERQTLVDNYLPL